MTTATTQPADHVASTISVSVVICCYTLKRRQGLAVAVDTVLGQLRHGDELIVVVDHNEPLGHDLRDTYGDRSTVVQNAFRRGLVRCAEHRAAGGPR